MNDNSALGRNEEARALTIALAIAAKAGWSMERAGSDLPAPYDAHFYVRSAELLVVPTSSPLLKACSGTDAGTRHARSDALIVSTADGDVALAIGMWTLHRTRWHVPVRPWLCPQGLLWMFATGREMSPEFADENITFPIRQGRLMRGFVPWATRDERLAGEQRASAWLTEVVK